MEATKLSVKAFTLTSGLMWAGIVFFVGILNIIKTGYGLAFLSLISSIYPGYHAEHTFLSVLIGTAYALLDGAICGLLFSWIYNRFTCCKCNENTSE
ncbi:MAG: hypothetical protein Q8Q33_10355 [Chlamydiota bacterium]|nr:hypothetical protein [Chlamydiota bacterium]